jgi:hypothetical protein
MINPQMMDYNEFKSLMVRRSKNTHHNNTPAADTTRGLIIAAGCTVKTIAEGAEGFKSVQCREDCHRSGHSAGDTG